MPDRKKILFNDPHANSNSFLMNERLNDPLAYRNNISQQNQEWKPVPPVDAIYQGQYIEPRLSPAKIAVHHYPTPSLIADGDNIRNSFSKQLLSGGIHAQRQDLTPPRPNQDVVGSMMTSLVAHELANRPRTAIGVPPSQLHKLEESKQLPPISAYKDERINTMQMY